MHSTRAYRGQELEQLWRENTEAARRRTLDKLHHCKNTQSLIKTAICTVMYNWIYVVSVAGGLDTSNDKAFAWMSQMVARQTAVSQDLNVFELMPR